MLSLAYVDAVIEEFPLGQCYPGQTAAQGCTGTPARQDLSGQRPPQAPEFKATAGFDYSRLVRAAVRWRAFCRARMSIRAPSTTR